MEAYSSELLWLVVISFIVAFILSFGIGANDVANSFGTSVGARVLSMRAACILATIFEIAGAVLIGYRVSDTLRKVLIETDTYDHAEKELILGYLSSLGGSGIWLLAATACRLPISGTHSIVGATIGFSVVARGMKGLQWTTLLGIVSSWFISPICSGIVSVVVYVMIRKYILNSPNPVRNGLQSLPVFYGVTIAINVYSVIEDGSLGEIPLWGSLLVSFFIGLLSAVIVYLVVVPKHRIRLSCIPSITRANTMESGFQDGRIQTNGTANSSPYKRTEDEFYIIRKYDERSTDKIEMNEIKIDPPKIPVSLNEDKLAQKYSPVMNPQNNHQANNLRTPGKENSKNGGGTESKSNASAIPLIEVQTTGENKGEQGSQPMTPNSEDGGEAAPTMRTPIEIIFTFLQILTAIFGSFAHGGNDVSNAIGPLVAIWLIYSEGSVQQMSKTPFLILLYGGIGISVGLWVWGRNVIKTVGEDLTRITPSTGFSIELGSSLTVLLASKFGVPISTTHCKVGSVVFVGWSSSNSDGVDWGLFKNIIFAWVITLPVSAVLSGGLMFLLSRYLL